jgi:GntR family transcriptional regulator
VLPEGGPHAGAGVVHRMAAIGVTVSHAVEQPEPRTATTEEASLLGVQKATLVTNIRRTYYSDLGRAVETADIVVPVAHCEIVYAMPIKQWFGLSPADVASRPGWRSSRSCSG